jgi:hypothetical protein
MYVALTDSHQYSIPVSKILVGPPPEGTIIKSTHIPNTLVVVSGLPQTVTDSNLKRECTESVGRPKYIYMHVADPRTGIFSGTAVVEFQEESAASNACASGILSCKVRPVTQQEFESLTSGDWPMLEYGPPQGVFASQSVQQHVQSAQPATGWRQPSVAVPTWQQAPPRTSNPWQK